MKNNIKLILTVSVFLNLLLGSFVAGHYLRWLSPKERMEKNTMEIAKVLPVEKREKFINSMQNSNDKSPMDFERMKQVREESFEILTAEKFDKQKFITKLDQIDRNFSQFHKNMTRSIADAADGLSQQERVQLAEQLKKIGPRGSGGGGRNRVK